ncbi:KxYKxGKxW signal peptide containing protein, partial [Weissella bombi]
MGLNKIHYKMYKNGKKWVFAGLTTITIGGSLIIFDTHVHADEGSVVGVGKDTITNNKVTEISENKSEAVSAVSVAASNSTNSQAANVLGNKSEA